MRDNSFGESNTYTEQKGVVANTRRLNIRATPDLAAKVVSIASEGDVLTLDTNFQNPTFYKVKTERGVRGYCVKVYVKVDE